MLRPTVQQVKPLPNYKLALNFDNGEKKIFDVSSHIKGEWYSELLDVNYFNKVFANGVTIQWPNEQDIDPDELYEKSV